MPRPPKPPTTNVRINADLYTRVKHHADRRVLGPSRLIELAVVEILDRLDAEDAATALGAGVVLVSGRAGPVTGSEARRLAHPGQGDTIARNLDLLAECGHEWPITGPGAPVDGAFFHGAKAPHHHRCIDRPHPGPAHRCQCGVTEIIEGDLVRRRCQVQWALDPGEEAHYDCFRRQAHQCAFAEHDEPLDHLNPPGALTLRAHQCGCGATCT